MVGMPSGARCSPESALLLKGELGWAMRLEKKLSFLIVLVNNTNLSKICSNWSFLGDLKNENIVKRMQVIKIVVWFWVLLACGSYFFQFNEYLILTYQLILTLVN